MTRLLDDVDRGADISDCGRYRYRLWRAWDFDKPLVCFCMLNPSTADATADDPTIRRCVGFARRWGHGGIMVVNLFALRATDPRELTKVSYEDAVGPENDEFIRSESEACVYTVCAWGSPPRGGLLSGRGSAVIGHSIARPHVLAWTKEGFPRHPLYLPAALDPRPWAAARAEIYR